MDSSAAQTPALLLLDLPTATFCGIDLLSFTTSPRFQGIKNLPPGWHFVFTGATSAFSLRSGVWFYVESAPSSDESVPSPQLIIKRWNVDTECLEAVTDEKTVLHWRANLGSIWREGLTPYRQSALLSHKATRDNSEVSTSTAIATSEASADSFIDEKSHIWLALTSKITSSLLARILGSSSRDHYSITSASCAAEDVENIPGISRIEAQPAFHEQELQFSQVDLKQTWREGAVGRERTNAARDRSWALENMMTRQQKSAADAESEVIGELQFCFLTTLILNNISCFEQWKRIITLLLTCQFAVIARPQFYISFLQALRIQLERSEEDVESGLFNLSDAESGANLLKSLFRRFRVGIEQVATGTTNTAIPGLTAAGIDEAEAKQDVLDELEDLEDYLKEAHGWTLNEAYVKSGMIDLEDGERVPMDIGGANEGNDSDEDGEYAPVLVDLTPEQAKALQSNLQRLEGRELTLNQRRTIDRDENALQDSSGEEKDRGNDSDEEDEQDIEEMDARF